MDQYALFYTPDGDLVRRDVADEWDLPASVQPVARPRTGIRVDALPPGHSVRPGPDLLLEFIALESAGTETIAQYARRWGALTTCQHRETWEIHRVPGPAGSRSLIEPAPTMTRRFVEPLEMWRATASRARAILHVARALAEGQPGSPEAWLAIEGQDLARLFPFADAGLLMPRMTLAAAMNRWLSDSHVMPRMEWSAETPGYRHRLGGLSAAIAHALLLAITSSAGLYSCSNCGKSYFRSLNQRRPKPGQMNYCDECSNPKGWARGQSQRRRANRKEST